MALVLSVTTVYAGPYAWVIGGDPIIGIGHFGKVDLTTGSFQQIGANAPVGTEGLAAGPNGLLYTIAYNSDLYSINPLTGTYSLVGPTGLGACSDPNNCAANANLTLGAANGIIYTTDFSNDLYRVDPVTGAATLIGPTSIPALPFVPGLVSDEGIANFYEETIFGSGGRTYMTFDAIRFDLNTFSVDSVLVPANIWEINPLTGAATVVGPTDPQIGAVASVNGTHYGFNLFTGNITTIDAATGNTSIVTAYDPAAGVLRGATEATPEPASIALAGLGLVAFFVSRRATKS